MTSLLNALPGAVSQGLIWGIMAIGLYITYKLLDVADLTVDGSFCTGGAVCVMMVVSGYNLWIAMLAAFAAGMLAGLVTGIFHTKFGIPAILSGILTQLGLWSVNLAIMGMKANQALNVAKFKLLISLRYVSECGKGISASFEKLTHGEFSWATVYQLLSYLVRHPIFVASAFTLVIILALYWFFGTERGAAIRATGANRNMAKAQGINTNVQTVLGLMLSNGLVALSGSLLSQYQSFADINMGRGAIVIGLAAIIIGEVALGKLFRNFALKLLAVSIGAVIYYIVLQAVISLMKINSNYLKLISALIVAVFLAIPNWRKKFPIRHKEAANAQN